MKADKIKLLSLMSERGFKSRKALADKIGVTAATVCKVVNGAGGSLDTFKRIAAALNCSVYDFLLK